MIRVRKLAKHVGITLLCVVAFTVSAASVEATTPSEKTAQVSAADDKAAAAALLREIENLDKQLKENNIWSKIYSNYHTYKELKEQEDKLDKKIEQLKSFSERRLLNKQQRAILDKLKSEKVILEGKLQLLKEYEHDPFKKFLKPPEIGDVPQVSNPFSIISAISFLEKLKNDQNEYQARFDSIHKVLNQLKAKEKLLIELLKYDMPEHRKYRKELDDTREEIKTFLPVVEIFKTTQNVYTKKIDEIRLNLQTEIHKEIERATNIGIVILVLLIVAFVLKYLVKRYMSDTERFYTINKFINFTFITFALLTLLFAYIENVNYLVTILGFASAGIAIAMKDWFMSLMGWFVIIIGGAVHVGDRVKFVRNGMEYVGDIIDISLLRMTIQEDITLTTYMHNRRAGRIIFVPNNYIFTDMIANYTHAGLKTVWDGIDFTITFDSNAVKAASIAKEVTKKYAKGYTEITRKQLNKLRSQYSVKNTNVEPRIYSFIEPYGIKISAWYHTNAYATLTLRSTISMEIIERIQAEDDIHLAYPSQSIYIDKPVRKPSIPQRSLFEENNV